MDLQNFLYLYVEQYLIGDIRKLLKIKPVKSGGCGYPLVSTVCSGIELLGALTFVKDFKPRRDGEDHFNHFWETYLTVINSTYRGKGSMIYQLTRNGIAHVFLAKPGVVIVNGVNEDIPIVVNKNTKQVFIHLKSFSSDFLSAYTNLIQPKISGDLGIQMQNQLDLLIDSYSDQSNRYFDDYNSIDSVVDTSLKQSRVSASLPWLSNQTITYGIASVPNSTDTNVSVGIPTSVLKKMA